MRSFSLLLEDRIYQSEWQRNRYREDPAWRLDRINRTRTRRGMTPASSLDEIARRV